MSLFFLGNDMGSAWDTTQKTWNTFTSAIGLVPNNASEMVIHQYAFPSTIQCIVTVNGSHNGTQTDTICNITEISTPPVFYVQGGTAPEYILYELTFPGTIMNLSAYTNTASGTGGTFELDRDEIVFHGQTNHTVEKHTVRFKVTAPEQEGPVDITLHMKNICRVPYTRLLFRYVVDNTPPQPTSVRILHQFNNGSSWITDQTYTHDTYISGWSGSIGTERIVWELAFDEPLVDAMNTQFQFHELDFPIRSLTICNEASYRIENLVQTDDLALPDATSFVIDVSGNSFTIDLGGTIGICILSHYHDNANYSVYTRVDNHIIMHFKTNGTVECKKPGNFAESWFTGSYNHSPKAPIIQYEHTGDTLNVYLHRDGHTDTMFDNVNRVDSNGLHIGAELSVALQPIFDRAGNSYEYDSKSTDGTNPACVLRVKTTIPQMTTYDIAAVDPSIFYWDTASIPSGTVLDITVSFDCEVDIQNIIWKDMNNTEVTMSVQSNGTSSAFSASATWRYTVPSTTSDIRFTLSNIKDRATNTLTSVVIPPHTVDTANVTFGVNGDYSTSTIYRKSGDTVTLRIESNTPSETPLVKIAGQTVPGPDVLGDITINNGNADSSTMWTVSYTIPTPSNDVPPQGPASVFIRTENSAGKNKHTTAHNVLHIDTIQPTVSSITISGSNDEDPPQSHRFAGVGDTVSLTIQTNEAIESPTGTWFTGTTDEIPMNNPWIQTDTNNPSQWSTTLTITESMLPLPQGPMSFTVAYTDLSGNAGLDKNNESVISEADVDENVTIDTEEPVVVYYATIPDDPPFTQRIENGNSVTFPLGYLGPLSTTFGPDLQWQNVTVLENNTFLTSNNNVTWTPIETSEMIYYEWSSSSSSYSSLGFLDDYKLIFFRDGTVDFVQTLDTNQSTASSNHNGPPSWNGHSSVSEIRRVQFDQDLRDSNAINIGDTHVPVTRSNDNITFTTNNPDIPAQALVQDNSYNWNKTTWETHSSPIVLSDYFSPPELPTDVFFNGTVVADTPFDIKGTCTMTEVTLTPNANFQFGGETKFVLLASEYDISNTLTFNY